jgi:CNT family concentrative nucleoside transporter
MSQLLDTLPGTQPLVPPSASAPEETREPGAPRSFEPTPLAWRLWIGTTVAFLVFMIYTVGRGIGNSPRFQAIYGAMAIIGTVALFSRNLNAVNWRTIAWGILLQVFIGAFVTFELYLPSETGVPQGYQPGHELFKGVSEMFRAFAVHSARGAEFIFNDLANKELPIYKNQSVPFFIAVIPTLIVVAAFFTLMFYFGIVQFIVKHIARGMSYMMGTSGAETLSAVSNVFMGQTEAPLIVKPYIAGMTRSELLSLMVGGMATVSGAIMVVYVTQFNRDAVDLLFTSLMAAPCGLYLSKLMLPETETPETLGVVKSMPDKEHRNALDAIAGGASDGLYQGLNICGMLIAFLALTYIADGLLKMIPYNVDGLRGWLGDGYEISRLELMKRYVITLFVYFCACMMLRYPVRWILRKLGQEKAWETWKKAPLKLWVVFALLGYLLFLGLTDLIMRRPVGELSLQVIFSKLFHPLALMMGTSWEDAGKVAHLLGTKLVFTEFLAFQELNRMAADLQPRSEILSNFALTGFANFASVGIQIAGISAMAPSRRPDLAKLGIMALFIGFLTTVLNAAIIGIFKSV